MPSWVSADARPLVGLNVSGLLQMGGYSKDNMFGLAVDYPTLIDELIAYFTKEANAHLVLVTHVTGAPGGHESDATACEALFAKHKASCQGRLHLADPSYNHREIKYLIGKCDFFLGARLHACIAALSQGVPAVGMAYSRKFVGVFESLQCPELVVDLRANSNQAALSLVKDLYRDRERLASVIAGSSQQARSDAYGIFSRILSVDSSVGIEPGAQLSGVAGRASAR